MITLWRGNSFTEIHGANPDTLIALSRHIAVPLADGSPVKWGHKYHHTFKAHDEHGTPTYWATLVHHNKVAAGLTPHVMSVLDHYKQPYTLRDARVKPEDNLPLWSVTANWRWYQDEVHRRIMECGTGVIVAPPRSGKTLMMARAIDALNHKTLVVAPSLAIVRQTWEVFRGIFGDALVSRVDGEATEAERDLSKRIVVSTIASAIRLPQEFFDACSVLAIDEFHHGAAESYHKLNALTNNIYYRLCFTGTHFRTDDADKIAMEAICSMVLADIPVSYLVENQWLAQPRYVMVRPDAPWITASNYNDAYDKGIVNCDKRNDVVAKIASTIGNANGIPTIVLVKRRAHAKLLGKMIADSAVVMGGDDALTNQKIRDFRRGHLGVLVGTTVIGEGVDLPAAGALVYASGGGASVQQIQSYFRPLTMNSGKTTGLIYDFKDQHHMTLSRHSEERLMLGERCLGTTAVRLW